MARYHVTISGQGYNAMADLVREHQVRVLHKTVQSQGRQRYTVDALVDEQAIPRLVEAGYEVQRNYDPEQVGRERQKEVGRGNRYARR